MNSHRLSQKPLGVWTKIVNIAIKMLVISETSPPNIILGFLIHQDMRPTIRATIGGMPKTKSRMLILFPPKMF